MIQQYYDRLWFIFWRFFTVVEFLIEFHPRGRTESDILSMINLNVLFIRKVEELEHFDFYSEDAQSRPWNIFNLYIYTQIHVWRLLMPRFVDWFEEDFSWW